MARDPPGAVGAREHVCRNYKAILQEHAGLSLNDLAWLPRSRARSRQRFFKNDDVGEKHLEGPAEECLGAQSCLAILGREFTDEGAFQR